MLRNVLGDYLDRVQNERAFDVPFMALLPEMGFYNIHFIHGNNEFGKDFIAKRLEDNRVIQYAFQSKAGDIDNAEWRAKIMGQLHEAVLIPLSHPNFDANAPRQVVLVCTGDLAGNTRLAFQSLNQELARTKNRAIGFWGKSALIDYLEKYGLTAIPRATASGLISYAQFFLTYSKALDGKLPAREIELYSCYWLDQSTDADKRLLRAAIESEIIATQCAANGFVYESIHAHLGALRVVLDALHNSTDPVQIGRLIEIHEQAMLRLQSSCNTYFEATKYHWLSTNRDLVVLTASIGGMVTYLVHCAQILEIAGCLYFLADSHAQEQIINFIADFAACEEGCGRIPSDRYAISIVLPALALCRSGRTELARQLIQRAVVWLCDRYEKGMGLARFDADENEEVATLLGYSFECIKVEHRGDSFLATVVADLAALIGDPQFYSDVINDIKAIGVAPIYWQVKDTDGLFRIEGSDILMYPNVGYADAFTHFELYQFADHIKYEPDSFRIAELVGVFSTMPLMLLLRDRYFPKLWPRLVNFNRE